MIQVDLYRLCTIATLFSWSYNTWRPRRFSTFPWITQLRHCGPGTEVQIYWLQSPSFVICPFCSSFTPAIEQFSLFSNFEYSKHCSRYYIMLQLLGSLHLLSSKFTYWKNAQHSKRIRTVLTEVQSVKRRPKDRFLKENPVWNEKFVLVPPWMQP